MSYTITRKVINAIKPYTVTTQDSDGDTFKHKAWSTREALSWARCYGQGWGTTTIKTRTGRFVASVTR